MLWVYIYREFGLSLYSILCMLIGFLFNSLQRFMTISSLTGSLSFTINVNEHNIEIKNFCGESR